MKPTIDLARLAAGLPGITPAVGAAMAEAGSVCLESEGHAEETPLSVNGDFNRAFSLHRLEVTEQMRKSHRFETTATERGACGVAALLIGELTPYTVVEEAVMGTHFDYWLHRPDGPLFEARLEVSGLRHASEADIRARVRDKEIQIGSSDELLPGFVVVVEFSRPTARIVRR